MVEEANKLHVLYYDKNFLYIGEEYIDSDTLPPNSTDVVPDPEIITPRFDKKKNTWVEAATDEYKDSIKPDPPSPSEIEEVRKQIADLYYLIAMGGA